MLVHIANRSENWYQPVPDVFGLTGNIRDLRVADTNALELTLERGQRVIVASHYGRRVLQVI